MSEGRVNVNTKEKVRGGVVQDCVSYEFESKMVKTEPYLNYRIEITFDRQMTKTRSKLEFSVMMILTTLGGHIGVCRTCLWLGLSLAGIK